MSFGFSSLAFAQSSSTGQAPSLVEMLVMPLGFLAIFYFFIIRPQQRKAREQRDFLTNLKVGDEVVTTGGIIGKVRSVAEAFITLETSGNSSIKVLKSHVNILSLPSPQATQVKAPKEQKS